jgi:hypothetical protein
MAIVANRDPQYVKRNRTRLYHPPGAIVPATRIPVIILVNPVQAIVKEIVSRHLRGIVDRISRHRNQLRKQRQVDPDADMGCSYADAHLR